MSKMLSGVLGSGSRTESECGEKMTLANARNFKNLRDTRPSTHTNCIFLTLAIPGNFARLSARGMPLPIDSEQLHAQEALGAKTLNPRFSQRVSHPSGAKRQPWLTRMSFANSRDLFLDVVGARHQRVLAGF
jgi:hypothetical protein